MTEAGRVVFIFFFFVALFIPVNLPQFRQTVVTTYPLFHFNVLESISISSLLE